MYLGFLFGVNLYGEQVVVPQAWSGDDVRGIEARE